MGVMFVRSNSYAYNVSYGCNYTRFFYFFFLFLVQNAVQTECIFVLKMVPVLSYHKIEPKYALIVRIGIVLQGTAIGRYVHTLRNTSPAHSFCQTNSINK